MNEKRETEVLAGFVHGALSFGHALGLVYAIRKGNKIDALIHAGVLAFDVYATQHHMKAVKKEDAK